MVNQHQNDDLLVLDGPITSVDQLHDLEFIGEDIVPIEDMIIRKHWAI